MQLGTYIKAAFTYRWNLLALLGALGVALLSGQADVLVPLALAGEVTYLGLLATHPRFQRAIDAREAGASRRERTADAPSPAQVAARMIRSLPPESVRRFEQLRAGAAELRELARQMRHPRQARPAPPLERLQIEGLDRLLWLYLRLLYTEHVLSRFLRKAQDDRVRADIEQLEQRLAALPAEDPSGRNEKLQRVIQDNLATSRVRLENYQKARDNHEFVQLEIAGLENKIRSLSELAINRHEPDFISGQVDQVVAGMVQTERTMSELQFVAGLDSADDDVPPMLERDAVQLGPS